MKKTKRVVAALLTGTLAFSSVVGVAPMMAFADEAVTGENANAGRSLEVIDGQVQDPYVDENGDPIIGAESFGYYPTGGYYGPTSINGRYDRVRGLGYVGYDRRYGEEIVVLGGPYNASVVVSTNNYNRNRNTYYNNARNWCFYAPTTNRYNVRDCYAYGGLYYPRNACDYSVYNGTVSFDLYREYAYDSVLSVQNALNNKSGVSTEDLNTVSNALSGIRSASSWSTVETWLNKVKTVADKYKIPMTTSWYLPYNYSSYCNWRDYSWNYNWRPCCDSKEYKADIRTVDVYRLFNKETGEHVYNNSLAIRDEFVKAGWKSEDIAWKAVESSKTPVYQLHSTDGHYYYTTDAAERDNLVTNKWIFDGVAFYASDSGGVQVYRLKHPTQNTYVFTSKTKERNELKKAGWIDEKAAFKVYG